MKAIGGFLWPRNNFILQLNAIFCIGLLVVTRITGLLLPIYSKLIVDELSSTPKNNQSSFETFALSLVQPVTWPWKLIALVVFLRFLQGGGTGSSGFFNNLRTTLWVKIEQYTSMSIATKLFSHLHGYSKTYSPFFLFI
jgi:ATP-binding cassette subfamily B (MDR/TAP) protein 6